MARDEFLRLPDAGRMAGISLKALRKRIDSGEIPAHVYGATEYVRRSQIVAWCLAVAHKRLRSTATEKAKAPLGLLPALPGGTVRGEVRFLACPVHRVPLSLFVVGNEVRCHFGCKAHELLEALRREAAPPTPAPKTKPFMRQLPKRRRR